MSDPIRPQDWYRSQVAFVALSRADSRESVTPPHVDATVASPAASPSVAIRFNLLVLPVAFHPIVDLLVSPAKRQVDARHRFAAAAPNDRDVGAADGDRRARADEHAADRAARAVLVATGRHAAAVCREHREAGANRDSAG